jgi:hypothetical protein
MIKMQKFYLILLSILCLFLLTSTLSFGQTVPDFKVGQMLTFSNGANLIQPSQVISVPCAVDWDGDGARDLLVGYFYNGHVYKYMNSGSTSSPAFIQGSQTTLTAGGNSISVAYG